MELVATAPAVGDTLRFHRGDEKTKYIYGRMTGTNRDGSIDLCDEAGRIRSIRRHRLEVKRRGPRGGVTWQTLNTE